MKGRELVWGRELSREQVLWFPLPQERGDLSAAGGRGRTDPPAVSRAGAVLPDPRACLKNGSLGQTLWGIR